MEYLAFDGVYFGLEHLVLVGAVEEAQGDDVARVLEGDGRLFVGGRRQVVPVHAHDLVAALHLNNSSDHDSSRQ